MAEPITISSDRDLVDAARNGDGAAWAELVGRHRPALLRVARSMKSSGAAKRVDVALAHVHDAVLSGEIDLDAVVSGEAQLRDVRCRGLAALTGGTVGPAMPPPHQRIDDVRRTETPDRQDLLAIAAAFMLAPWAWQTVLWHSRAEGRTATEVGPLLGRSANDVSATLIGADAGLFELYLRADAARISDLDPTSAALLPLLGGHRRGVLSPTDRRRVEELLDRRSEGSPDGVHARRWMAVGASFDSLVPQALVPGLVGQSIEGFWAALGIGTAALGTAELAAARSERVQRTARLGAVAAIIVAILGGAFLIRNPFDGLDASWIADVLAGESATPDEQADTDDGDEQDASDPTEAVVAGDGSTTGVDGTGTGGTSTGGTGADGSGGTGTGGTAETGTTTSGTGTEGTGTGGTGTEGTGTGGTGTGGTGTGGTGTGGTGTGGTPPGGTTTGGTGTGGTTTGGTTTGGTTTGGTGTGGTSGGEVDTLDDQIDLAFPGARQGAVYVPGQGLLRLRAELSAGSPFVAGGTGTLGLVVTNEDDETANVQFDVRSTAGIRLVSSGGTATCGSTATGVSSCSFTLPPEATVGLTLVFGLDASLLGEVTIVPTIPGAALRVPIV